MRLSLIFFGLSSVFMIVSSLPLGSIGLEKRQASGVVQGAGAFNQGAQAATGAVKDTVNTAAKAAKDTTDTATKAVENTANTATKSAGGLR
ncbi:hypothetical protein G6F43_005447 [Rhizopus delemar]|nr:hypothetical protein G6F43_005447 [Rhizopus delemar]